MIKTNELLQLFNIKTKKEFGQNFLINEDIADEIVSCADITKDDLVIEIGPGVGSLTQRLCEEAGFVAAVELDTNMEIPLKYVLNKYSNCAVIFEDILKIDINNDIINRYTTNGICNVKIVANLPYYIATQIITKLLSQCAGISKMVIMVQKEVAQRICALPEGREYGILSVAVQIYARPAAVIEVLRDSFHPSPKVDSTVIILDIYKTIPYDIDDIDFFFKVVKAAFSQRRKTVSNSLYAGLNKKIPKQTIEDILVRIGEDLNVRAERISIQQFCVLVKNLKPLF
jgi:16S rRNA (adenine1518-N6/adenine1519-N6)-dimethyltransferase